MKAWRRSASLSGSGIAEIPLDTSVHVVSVTFIDDVTARWKFTAEVDRSSQDCPSLVAAGGVADGGTWNVVDDDPFSVDVGDYPGIAVLGEWHVDLVSTLPIFLSGGVLAAGNGTIVA